jgi:hypothetical protein
MTFHTARLSSYDVFFEPFKGHIRTFKGMVITQVVTLYLLSPRCLASVNFRLIRKKVRFNALEKFVKPFPTPEN